MHTAGYLLGVNPLTASVVYVRAIKLLRFYIVQYTVIIIIYMMYGQA